VEPLGLRHRQVALEAPLVEEGPQVRLVPEVLLVLMLLEFGQEAQQQVLNLSLKPVEGVLFYLLVPLVDEKHESLWEWHNRNVLLVE
jgi:hypothetical protein